MLRKGFAHCILPVISDFNSNSPVNGINPVALHVGKDQLLSLTRQCLGLTEATAVCKYNNRDA